MLEWKFRDARARVSTASCGHNGPIGLFEEEHHSGCLNTCGCRGAQESNLTGNLHMVTQASDWCEILQARLASGEDIFGPLIQKYLLKNSHCIRVDTLPDDELAAKQDADEKARLGDIRRQMDSTQEQGVIAETVELQRRQVSNLLARGSSIVDQSCLDDALMF